MSEKASKGRFPSLKPKKLKNHCKERKGKEKKKSEEKVAFLVFTIATLEMLWKKTSVARKKS